jgi:hypothetical protein
MAAAIHRGLVVVTDERAARKYLTAEYPTVEIGTTETLVVSLILAGALSVEDADAVKAEWEANWSGDWDIALRAAIERCPTRRFTTFWAARGEPTVKAMDLIRLRAASMISITDADVFFRELLDKVLALETFGEQDPVSAKVAVARAAKFSPLRF